MDMRGRYPKSPAHRAKLAEAARRQAAERKAAGLSSPNRGIKMSEAARANMSLARRGNKNAHRHGQVNTPTHNSWRDMLGRVRQPNYPNYHRYGGRGITVCARWLDFRNFYADMGARPAGTTLDRINNDGHYEPGNCRWATPKEQAANRSYRRRGDAP